MSDEIFALLPRPTNETRPFWEGCNRGELLLAHCTACGHVFYYPRLYCPKCGSDRLGWKKASGRGVLYSFTHVHVSFYGPTWESQLPYTLVLVDLEEGPRMLSRLTGSREQTGRAAIGQALELDFVQVEQQKIPYFRIVEAIARSRAG